MECVNIMRKELGLRKGGRKIKRHDPCFEMGYGTDIIQYYAWARNPEGEVAQLLVTRRNGKQINQVFTGVTYKDDEEAAKDIERLNCQK